MQNQPSLDLQETAHFNVQKIIIFGPGYKKPVLKSNIDNKYKKSQRLDTFFNNNHAEFIQDKSIAAHKEIQQQETKKRIDLFQNAENFNKNHKNMTKDIKYIGNFSYDEPALTFEEQVNNIIPTVLRESLKNTSRICQKQCKVQQKSTNNENMVNDNQSSNSSNVQIDLNLVSCLYQAQETAKQQRISLKKLSLNKQIAITYKPFKYTKYGANKIGLYQKFDKKYHEKQDVFSSQSLYSNKLQQNNQLKDCMVNSTANFSKLHQVDLFMKRKEIRLQRSDQLLQANQKLLAGHLTVKKQLQKVKKTLNKVTSQYKSKIQNLQNQLKIERQTKIHILAEKEVKQISLKNTKALNQQYVKENNDLKEKIKQYVKIIHELKYYSVTKSTNNQHTHLQLQSKSQKSVIIKRNITSQNSENIHNHFVKFNKNPVNDSSLIMKRRENQQNKSISSNSNISGMSLTNKIGYIPKYHQTKKGVLLDYMAQECNDLEKQNKRKPQKEKDKIQDI